MSRFKTIQYAIHSETGAIISKVGNSVAIDIPQYDGKNWPPTNKTKYQLEKIQLLTLAPVWDFYRWTRKIPFVVKNRHRLFWGMKRLTRDPNSHELTAQWKGVSFKHGEEIYTVVRVVAKENNRHNVVYLKDGNGIKVDRYFDGMVSWLNSNPQQIILEK